MNPNRSQSGFKNHLIAIVIAIVQIAKAEPQPTRRR